MSVNNYECPRCHNVFPEMNKFLHDQYCTVSKPVPLNQSRVAFLNEQSKAKKKEEVKHISRPNYKTNNRDFNINNNNKHQQQINEGNKDFTCWLCGATLKESEKLDHMLCHQMQEEVDEFKKNNPKVENKPNNDINRPRRDLPPRQNQNKNQRNPQNNIRQENAIQYQQNGNGNNNPRRNLRRSQLKFSDWQIFDFGGLGQSINNMDNPDDILEQLPESEIEDTSQLSEDKRECIICLNNFKKSDKITFFPCTHMFHSPCVESWLKMKKFCPVCKAKIA